MAGADGPTGPGRELAAPGGDDFLHLISGGIAAFVETEHAKTDATRTVQLAGIERDRENNGFQHRQQMSQIWIGGGVLAAAFILGGLLISQGHVDDGMKVIGGAFLFGAGVVTGRSLPRSGDGPRGHQ